MFSLSSVCGMLKKRMPRLTALVAHATHLACDRVGIDVREQLRVAHVGGGARRSHDSELLVARHARSGDAAQP